MCQFCIQHGEGKIWYDNMKNYSLEIFSQVSSRGKYTRTLKNFRKNIAFWPFLAYRYKNLMPKVYDSLVYPRVTQYLKKHHFGQIVPLEDAENILQNVANIVLLPCVCRKVTTQKEERYCLGIGADMTDVFSAAPDFRNFETMTFHEARAFVRQTETEGMVHSVWTYETPFIGMMCNCNENCMAYNVQLKMNLATAMWKAEYIAKIDPEECNGCKLCQEHCLFDAVEYDLLHKKCLIDPLKCYGCGVCRSFCSKESINLIRKPTARQA